MDLLVPFALAFGAILLTEMGDKTQLMTISFASRYPKKIVFFGALLGLGIVAAIGVAIGILLGAAFDAFWIKIIASVIFIAFGVWTLLKREEEEEQRDIPDKKVFFQTTFIFILAELGDKTQVAIILLTANYSNVFGAPAAILVGGLLGFALIIAVGVIIGREIGKRIETRWIVLASGILFIVIGIIVAIEAFFGFG